MSWWTGTGRCFLREKYEMIDMCQWCGARPVPLPGVNVTQDLFLQIFIVRFYRLQGDDFYCSITWLQCDYA